MNTHTAVLNDANVGIDRRIGPLIGLIGLFAVMVLKEVHWPSAVMAAFAGLALLGLIMTGVNYPALPLYVLVVYLPFSRELVGNFGTETMAANLTNGLMGIVLLVHMLRRRQRGEPLFPGAPLSKFVWGFCALGAAALIRAGSQYGSWYFFEFLIPLKRWLTPVFLYFLTFWVVQEKRSWKAVVVLIMVTVAVVGAMAVWDYLQVNPNASLERTRIGSIAQNPNTLGAFFNYYMFLFLGFFLSYPKKRGRMWLLLLPFLLCFRGIMVTFSRGAYLAFAVGCLAGAWFRHKVLFLVVGVAVLLAALHPSVLPAGIRYRLGMTVTHQAEFGQDVTQTLEASAARRVDIWRGALAMIKDHPWWGVGYGAFPYYIEAYTGGAIEFMDAHNSYLLIAAEMGIPTLVWFLLILLVAGWYTYWLSRRASDRFIQATALGFLTGLCALLVVNFFGSRIDSQEVSGYLWVLMGLMMRGVLFERQLKAARVSSARRGSRGVRATSGKHITGRLWGAYPR